MIKVRIALAALAGLAAPISAQELGYERMPVRCGTEYVTTKRPTVPTGDDRSLVAAERQGSTTTNVDSLYGAARSLLSREQYADAVAAFEALVAAFPGSAYAPNALYWAAYALHRRGTDLKSAPDLQQACLAIARLEAWYPDAVIHRDAMGLLLRIYAAQRLNPRPPGR